jgi:hypothetical protein
MKKISLTIIALSLSSASAFSQTSDISGNDAVQIIIQGDIIDKVKKTDYTLTWEILVEYNDSLYACISGFPAKNNSVGTACWKLSK